MEDRGDKISVLVVVVNIIFLVLLTHIWMYISRNNDGKYINVNEIEQ